jgi:sugar/nucleoside kinase (ribokinase family)
VILCGHCKGRHATVDEVRACSRGDKMVDDLCQSRKERALTEEGIYTLNGDVFKVVRAQGSNRLYAKVFDADQRTFVYAAGAMKYLRAEHQMTEEQAAQFGPTTTTHPDSCRPTKLLDKA